MVTPIVDDLPLSPITPIQLGLDDQFQFNCHKGIACFNKCCQNIDIQLTPYDILRLKNHMNLSSQAFLHLYTVPFEMDAHGVPGVKLKTAGDESTACQLLTPEGCGVYADRPSACRYYALGLVSMRKTGSTVDEDNYFVVKEDHCLAHDEPKMQTVRQYRQDKVWIYMTSSIVSGARLFLKNVLVGQPLERHRYVRCSCSLWPATM